MPICRFWQNPSRRRNYSCGYRIRTTRSTRRRRSPHDGLQTRSTEADGAFNGATSEQYRDVFSSCPLAAVPAQAEPQRKYRSSHASEATVIYGSSRANGSRNYAGRPLWTMPDRKPRICVLLADGSRRHITIQFLTSVKKVQTAEVSYQRTDAWGYPPVVPARITVT